ncbi:cation diffusion facilitator family transporter [Enterococcus sp. LJL90]
MIEERSRELRQAEKGAIISIIAYILVSIVKLAVGNLANSEALRADGLNNVTDIIASVAVLIGLRLAQKPADEEHRYGHWKAENVASLVTSFIMLMVGLEVFYSSITNLISGNTQAPDLVAAIVGVVSAAFMYGVYFYNKKLSQKVNSSALLAAAKDNRSDAWTSIATAVAVLAATFNLGWIDSLAAVGVAVLILKTAFDIFKDSVFSLSDGFDQTLLTDYTERIENIPGIEEVLNIRGRSYGANIFLDIVVAMDPQMTVACSHQITDEIEEMLRLNCGVFDTDIHVEPSE